MKPEKVKKFIINLVVFTAPGLAIFFQQLQMGATVQVAGLTASLVVYGLLADFFSKLKRSI